ncbi:MAG: hypothetical protein A2161_07235 [Candidatus Schekmanbacteria bacterium RBG_13_48_7]|uniref:non-specific serine/threonine protein kinase n=1 Tax=Candidatus Schekmanbacteria bacterium RBG_13_48_7 TaxID=1817878 RepID=A0A1F7S0J0_9BACT|nr:MAG: hypothetical protein A2161_07235 [Candidatus Schekmanbacteria bacterium RBG_13_48_7]
MRYTRIKAFTIFIKKVGNYFRSGTVAETNDIDSLDAHVVNGSGTKSYTVKSGEPDTSFMDPGKLSETLSRLQNQDLDAEKEDFRFVPLNVPAKVGRYEITRVIGEGGMGLVYEADDPVLHRKVALKVINSRYESAKSRTRFYQEARAAARLKHPNIISVFDLDAEENQPFIAMELLEGKDLKSILKQKTTLPVNDCIQILITVLEALAHAHENGVIHRDIKPANIFICNDSTVKIMDFGLAKIMSESARLTRTGKMIGTLAYMSPEQVQGKTIDHRCDIFSAGVILYELLAQKHPFEAEFTDETILNILFKPPPEMKNLHSEISSDMKKIIGKALEKNPSDRYQTAAEMSSDLKKILIGEPVTGHRKSFLSRYRSRSLLSGKSHFLLYSLGFAFVIATVFLLIFFSPYFKKDEVKIPSGVNVLDRGFAVKDQFGDKFFTYQFDMNLDLVQYKKQNFINRYLFFDINNDGIKDFIFSTDFGEISYPNVNEIIYFLNNGKKLRESVRVTAGREVKRADQIFDNTFRISTMLSIQTRTGEPRILAVLRDIPYYPALIWLIDPDGKILNEYLHHGHLESAQKWDVNSDGYDEVIAGGTSNDFNCPFVIIVDPDYFGGASPTGPGRESWNDGMITSGRPMYVIKLLNVEEESHEYIRCSAIVENIINGSIKVVVVGNELTLDYFFYPEFRKIEVNFSEYSREIYPRFRASNPDLPEISAREEYYRDSILFWNGTDWIKNPVQVSDEQAL